MKKCLLIAVTAMMMCLSVYALAEGGHVHSYDYDVYQSDEACHWRVCMECGEKLYVTPHSTHCTSPSRGACEVCGAAAGEENVKVLHAGYEKKSDGEFHWQECPACGEVINKEKHTATCANPGVCVACGATEAGGAVIEDPGHDWQQHQDSAFHWDECTRCGKIAGREGHYATCSAASPDVCVVCGAAKADGATIGPVVHFYRSAWEQDAEGHWHVCAVCGEKSTEEAHTLKDGVCALCGYEQPQATQAPTAEPTAEPTQAPTEKPTEEPTEAPTQEPTAEPTLEPTLAPTEAPTANPTEQPTQAPTQAPTLEPTQAPTPIPTQAPTAAPTAVPTAEPAPYAIVDFALDGGYLSGRVVKWDGGAAEEKLFIRMRLVLRDGSDIIIAFPVQEDGSFEAAVQADVLRISLTITNTARCIRPQDVWNPLGDFTYIQ